IPDQQVTAGDTLTLDITPLDPERVVPIFHMLPALNGASFNDNGNGGRTLVWSPTDADVGQYSVEFIAIDEADPTISTSAMIQITVLAR
ncbi:MAG: hypothetical protein KTR35_16230, partial [Gammaproteobacteria bacterium]|nr:hypothetical protein [Gammaproteobacteria bacterium]